MDPLLLVAAGIGLWALLKKDSHGGGAPPGMLPPPQLPPGGAPPRRTAPPPAPRRAPPAAPPPAPPAPSVPQVKDRQRLDAAATVARLVAADLQKNGKRHNRALLQKFQTIAGLKPDGLYGPKSAGALKWYTGLSIPPLVGNGSYATYLPPF